MGGRRYRVVKRFRWIEGGRPAPGDGWEGGESVAYEPGDTVHMEDQDLEGMYPYVCVEALDEAGGAVLEEARAKAKAVHFTAVADISSDDAEFWARALRREDSWQEERIDYAILRDGTKQPLRVHPANPLPDVVYDDYGVPKPWDTALLRRRREMERELDRIHRGASQGRRQGHETKRDKTVRDNKALLAAVLTYRDEHPEHGRPAIAAVLVDEHGREIDHADPDDRRRAIAALVKRIERLEKKSLDT
ncbi:MAG: hypothetical protein JF614_25345 [Acidobacteria bacterium]|nr:hypothetical protein [Acidobacteriota bacterium]